MPNVSLDSVSFSGLAQICNLLVHFTDQHVIS